jgi:hypothetical protein
VHAVHLLLGKHPIHASVSDPVAVASLAALLAVEHVHLVYLYKQNVIKYILLIINVNIKVLTVSHAKLIRIISV